MIAPAYGWHSRSRFIDVSGRSAHFVRVDPAAPTDRTPVVLLHGLLVSSWAFRKNLDVLGRERPTIALCQLGHGWSAKPAVPYDVPTLAEFVLGCVDAMGLEHVDLVGNSLGGTVALHLAAHEPSRIRRLVLVNPAARAFHPALRAFLSAQAPWTAKFYRAIGQDALFRWVLRFLAYRQQPVDDEYMRWFMAPLRDRAAMAASVSAARYLPAGLLGLRPHLGAIRQPTLVVQGSRDLLVPARASRKLARELPFSQLELYAASGHCPMEDEPERFNAEVGAFLRAKSPDCLTRRSHPAYHHGDPGGVQHE